MRHKCEARGIGHMAAASGQGSALCPMPPTLCHYRLPRTYALCRMPYASSSSAGPFHFGSYGQFRHPVRQQYPRFFKNPALSNMSSPSHVKSSPSRSPVDSADFFAAAGDLFFLSSFTRIFLGRVTKISRDFFAKHLQGNYPLLN